TLVRSSVGPRSPSHPTFRPTEDRTSVIPESGDSPGMEGTEAKGSVWATRFIGLTFILGGVAWLVLMVLLIGNVLAGMTPPNYGPGPASSRIVAGGGAAAWVGM